MKRIGVLVSGGGTNLQALLDAQTHGILKSGAVALVVSDKPGAYALTRAENAGVETRVIEKKDYKDRDAFSAALADCMEEKQIDLVVMAGFMTIVTEAFFGRFAGRIINVHPALIPSFCGDGFYGLRVHRAVLDYGVKLTGATVHFVDGVTDGGAIILQKCVAVEDGDTPETLQKRVMEQAEWEILPQAAELFCAGRLTLNGRWVKIDS